MSVNKLKVMLSFMREVNDNNIPTATQYGITDEEFWDIIEACQEKGLIKDAILIHADCCDHPIAARLEGTKLTVDGMEYLNEHSTVMKTYRGIKEIREWLPF